MDVGNEPEMPYPLSDSEDSSVKYSMPGGMLPLISLRFILVICLRSPNVNVEPIVLLGIWRAISLMSHCWLSKSEA